MKGLFTPQGRQKLAHLLVYGAEPPHYVPEGLEPEWRRMPYPGEIVEKRITKALERIAQKVKPCKDLP